jgi:hypothetical protein
MCLNIFDCIYDAYTSLCFNFFYLWWLQHAMYVTSLYVLIVQFVSLVKKTEWEIEAHVQFDKGN